MKRYLRKIFDYQEPPRLFQKSINIHRTPISSSDKNFIWVKPSCLNRMFFNGGFKIYLPNHPEPQ